MSRAATTRHLYRELDGNTHEAGLNDGWDTVRRLWAEPTENRAALPEWLNLPGTRDQYLGGLRPELRDLHPRETWHLDWERLSRPGSTDIQFQLFYDYRHHVARFPEIAAYHREHQPPCLVLWGRHDPFFDIAEVGAVRGMFVGDVLDREVIRS